MDLVGRELPASTPIVAIDCGRATNRAMPATAGTGVIGEPVSLSTLREGIEEASGLIEAVGPAEPPLIAIVPTPPAPTI